MTSETSTEPTTKVQLYIYDLTNGMARILSPQLLGFPIDGVWHTSVVFDSQEYYFSQGIQNAQAGRTAHGPPLRVVDMGSTNLPREVITEFLTDLAESKYGLNAYDLLENNCNHFSHDFLEVLVGPETLAEKYPKEIKELPAKVLATPFGQMMKPYLGSMMASETQKTETGFF